MKEKNDREMVLHKNTLIGLQQEMIPFKKLKHSIPILKNIVEYDRKADGVTIDSSFTQYCKGFTAVEKNRNSILTSCP